LGDLDGDSALDAFAAVGAPTLGESSSLGDRILLNDGLGNYTDPNLRLGETDSYAVALGDIDSDGDLDVLVGTRSGAVVWINQAKEPGPETIEFGRGQQIHASETEAVFLKDLNADGALDALIAGSRQAVIWWNDGYGTFRPSDQHFRYTQRYGLAVEDFNGDGAADIFAASYSDAYLLWMNQGNGTFQPYGAH
jgi:hypothetical protein